MEAILTLRPPIGGPRRWQMDRREIDENTEFIAECLRLWDEGRDTKDIATLLFQPEYIIEATVRLGRERRRRAEDMKP